MSRLIRDNAEKWRIRGQESEQRREVARNLAECSYFLSALLVAWLLLARGTYMSSIFMREGWIQLCISRGDKLWGSDHCVFLPHESSFSREEVGRGVSAPGTHPGSQDSGLK